MTATEQAWGELERLLGHRLSIGPQGRLTALPPDPATAGEVMAIAARSRLTVLPTGRGARAHWGNPVTRADLEIASSGLERVTDYSPDDMVVSVQAGVSLADLNGLLSKHNQVLPLDLPFPAATTIGGLIAAAPLGLSRSGYGQVRDWLIGVDVIAADGVAVKGGSRVVKNVAGYDLCKLYAGSLGTLGQIVGATFKVRPRWETSVLVRAEVPSTDRIEDLLAAWQVTTLSPAIAVVELSKAGATFWLGFDGPAETVQWQSSVARTVLTDLGGQEATIDSAAVTRADLAQRLAGRVGAVTVLRASVLPSDILTYWHQADEMLAEKGVEVTSIAQIHHGTMWLSLTSETSPNWASLVSGLREKARSLGGNLVVERIPDEVAPVVDSFGLDAASLTLMKRLKRGLDPDDRLAPGRMWRES